MGCMRLRPDDNPVCPHCGLNGANLQNPPHQLAIYSILKGQYLVGKSLGQGGFGITYTGYDLMLERRVAIKEYYPEGFVCRQATLQNSQVLSYTGHKKDQFLQGREAFLMEARVLAKLATLPHVVHVSSFFQENGTAYIVMEYVEGETLKKLLKDRGGKLPFTEVMELLRPVMTSLGKIHEMGLLHRDISPDNIIIREGGDAVLLDFGAAVAMEDAMQHSIALNVKHGYAPIEQYTQHSNLGPWSDVYAMAATIYRAVTGVVPPQSIERAHGGATLKSPNSLGAGLTSRQEKALVQGLNIYDKDRIRSMEELANRLGGKPAKEAKVQEGEDQPARSKKGLIIALVCAVLAAAGGALAVFQPWQAGEEPALTEVPANSPASAAAAKPTAVPTAKPTEAPTVAKPTKMPTPEPTAKATATPTVKPTATVAATATPTVKPTETPTPEPTAAPTATAVHTATPTPEPTPEPRWDDGRATDYFSLEGIGYPSLMANLEGYPGVLLETFISEKDGGALLSGYMGNVPADGVLVLPDSVQYNNKDYPIIAICDDFLSGMGGVDKLYLPDSLTYISPLPFAGKTGLTIGGNPGTEAQRFAQQSGYAFEPNRFPPEATATPEPIATATPTVPPPPEEVRQQAEQAAPVMAFEPCDGGVKLVSYTGKDTVLVIPQEWEGQRVVEIALADSEQVQALTSVTIPEGVVKLHKCLNNCPSLTEVNFPATLDYVSAEALEDTPWLTQAEAAAAEGDGLMVLGGHYLFKYVGGDAMVTLPDAITVVGINAFSGADHVRSITAGKGLQQVRSKAFANMGNLVALDLGSGLNYLASDCLEGTGTLTMLSLNCSKWVTWEGSPLKNVRYLYAGSTHFNNFGGLTDHDDTMIYTLPGNDHCSKWRKDGMMVVEIADFASVKERLWPKVMLPGPEIHRFNWEYEYDPQTKTARLLAPLGTNAGTDKLTIPEKVSVPGVGDCTITELGEDFMRGVTTLKELYLSEALQRIGAGALNGCTGLTTVKVMPANPTKNTKDGVDIAKSEAKLVLEPGALRDTKWFSKAGTLLVDKHGRLLAVQPGKGTLYVNNNNKIKYIAPYALYGTAYEKIVLHKDLISIGDFAFAGMPNLKTINVNNDQKKQLPDGLKDIGHAAFAMTALDQLKLPANAVVGQSLVTGADTVVFGSAQQTEKLRKDGCKVELAAQ